MFELLIWMHQQLMDWCTYSNTAYNIKHSIVSHRIILLDDSFGYKSTKWLFSKFEM